MPIIRFLGICCHVNPRSPSDGFLRRIVLPDGRSHAHGAAGPVTSEPSLPEVKATGARSAYRRSSASVPEIAVADATPLAHEDHVHLPYVEVDERSIARVEFPDPNPLTVTRDNVRYRIFEVDREEIILEDVDESFPFHVHDSYRKTVPELCKVRPDLPERPDAAIFTSSPPPAVVSYFDVRSGILTGGDLEQQPTVFVPNARVWPIRRLARWSTLMVEITKEAPVITLRSFVTGRKRQIFLNKDAVTITIGNQPRPALTNPDHVATEPAQHFGLYYGLTSAALSSDPPLPAVHLSAVNGCEPTNWP